MWALCVKKCILLNKGCSFQTILQTMRHEKNGAESVEKKGIML
jgi:hypothetical protein